MTQQETIDRKGEKTTVPKWSITELGRVELPHLTALIKSGSRLYAGSAGRLLAYSLPLPEKGPVTPAWEIEIEGTPASLVAADGKLFAVTLEGQLLCFGDATLSPATPVKYELSQQSLATNEVGSARAEAILKASGVRDGYCVVWGLGSSGLVGELIRHSELRVIVVEPEASAADAFRNQLRTAGIGSERVTVLTTDPEKAALPPYLASLAIMESVPAAESQIAARIATMFRSLRPFGGVACLPVPPKQINALAASMNATQLAGSAWKPAGEMTLLVREGALPESADWTHEHADAANTRVSKDRLVKAPLGLLWFGGPSNDAILPRHGHGPQPQVVDGRLFIEGVDLLRAMDIYTGRVLWETQLPGLGALYDNTAHQPGANASGTNYIATPNGIYVAYGQACLRLDPATGQKTAEFKLPPLPGSDTAPLWGYLNVFEDYLLGGADPLFDPSLAKSRNDNDNYSSSQRLVVMDRTSGSVLWTVTATNGFRHNAICIGGGRVYCIDRMSGAQLSRLKRRGENPVDQPRLVVFDLKTGQEIWSTEQDVFGTWLSYSVERDVLVEAGRVAPRYAR